MLTVAAQHVPRRCVETDEIFAGGGFTKPMCLANLYFLTSAGNTMHSPVRKSSLVRRKGFMKPAPAAYGYPT